MNPGVDRRCGLSEVVSEERIRLNQVEGVHKMLFQTVIRDAKKNALTGKHSHVVQQIINSGRFVLDDNSTKAMSHLSIMKPSRILAAKDYLKLPFDSIWDSVDVTPITEDYEKSADDMYVFQGSSYQRPMRVSREDWERYNAKLIKKTEAEEYEDTIISLHS